MAKKSRNKIQGGFVAMEHMLIESEAFRELSNTSKIAFMYFRRDKKNGHQTEVILTFEQAQKYAVCDSPATFNKVKKELVEKGFLDPYEPGGLGKASIFSLSSRWKKFGTQRFERIKFTPGIGYKFFREAWKDDKRRDALVKARHKEKLNIDSV